MSIIHVSSLKIVPIVADFDFVMLLIGGRRTWLSSLLIKIKKQSNWQIIEETIKL